MKFYTIYKIINLINGKFYIGAHKTKNINDNYMGSGIGITRAIKKYGIENFDKEILYVLESEEEMYALEKEIVNEEFKKRDDTALVSIIDFNKAAVDADKIVLLAGDFPLRADAGIAAQPGKGTANLDFLAILIIREHVLFQLILIVRNNAVGSIHDHLGRTVVLF